MYWERFVRSDESEVCFEIRTNRYVICVYDERETAEWDVRHVDRVSAK